MHGFRLTAVIAAFCLAVVLTCCGSDNKDNSAETASSSDQVSAETADAQLGTDSEKEESEQEEPRASSDLFFEDGAVWEDTRST